MLYLKDLVSDRTRSLLHSSMTNLKEKVKEAHVYKYLASLSTAPLIRLFRNNRVRAYSSSTPKGFFQIYNRHHECLSYEDLLQRTSPELFSDEPFGSIY